MRCARFVCTVIAGLVVTTSCSAQTGQRLRNLSPPSFAVGGVLHGYDDPNTPATSYYNTDYRRLAAREFNAITATVYMGWNTFNNPNNYAGFDRVVNWTVNGKRRVHGHTLLYPLAQRDYWTNETNSEIQTRVNNFIDDFAGRHAGKIWLWDVVNEAMGDGSYDPNDNDPPDLMDGLGIRQYWEGDLNRPVREYWAYGGNSWYVENAFHRARAADPNAILIINDYGIGVENPKSDRLYNYVQYLLNNTDTPIDGVGFQMHWTDTNFTPSVQAMKDNMQRFIDLGLRVFVTELDVVATESGNFPTQAEQDRQKTVFKNVMQACLDTECEACLLWDFADDESWLNPVNTYDNPPGPRKYATPFWDSAGGNGNAKPAYYGLQEALQNHDSTYLVQNYWGSSNGFLSRDGDPNGSGGWNPSDTVSLTGSFGPGDQHVRFSLERIGTSATRYRIRATWGSGGQTGYLTRDNNPNTNVEIKPFLNSGRQIWIMEQVVNPFSEINNDPSINLLRYDTYRFRSQWTGTTGYLTRDGLPNGSGGWDPMPTVGTQAKNMTWSSQLWMFHRNR